MGALLQQLQPCCRNENNRDHIFVLEATATDALQRRSREMERKLLLEDANPNESLFAANPNVSLFAANPRSFLPSRAHLHSIERPERGNPGCYRINESELRTYGVRGYANGRKVLYLYASPNYHATSLLCRWERKRDACKQESFPKTWR
ncbi:hypothetical protein PHMEG_0009652 [Phytophthora megakarya]|uniref:Uncharacterized protein n=1 Tax=Phytophthora megakarya TaxID=4795 RepID=A0A225WHD6_9STRA|nr:hypothetical protein PHMEG_0009652 [Phytophthora megakarya]